MKHALTIDVEDYFHVGAFEKQISPHSWDDYECRVESNIDHILALLDEHDIKATFFTLGWVAQRYPKVIRDIVAQGHELASHGMNHTRVFTQDETSFRQDVKDTKSLLEHEGQCDVKGYRAASFSINESNLWALDILADEGYRYSSSIYPIQHDHYGMKGGQRFKYHPIVGSDFIEVPPTTARLWGRNLPASGGGYFRLLPYLYTKFVMNKVIKEDQQSVIFYFHPWEVDPEQPRILNAPFKSRFRHYTNLSIMESKLSRLMQSYEWGRMDEIFLTEQG